MQLLRDEYERVIIGPRILGEVERTIRTVVRRFDPVVYAGVDSWQDGLDDLVQEVVLKVLIEEHQLEYLMTTARGSKDFRLLLQRQVERQLARRRRRTVVDNLLDRCRDILRSDDYVSHRVGRRTYYSLNGRVVEQRAPTREELRRVSIRVAAIPRIAYRDTERAPQIYSTPNLEALLRITAELLPTWLEIGDLDTIFRDVLTGWIPSLLGSDEAVHYQADTKLSPEDELIASSASDQIYDRLTPEQRLILVRKLEGHSDSELAQELGVSRPTAATRKDEVLKVLERGLDDLSTELQDAVIDRVTVRALVEVSNA